MRNGYMNWDEESEAYRNRKLSEGAEMGWLLAVCIFVACLIAIARLVFH